MRDDGLSPALVLLLMLVVGFVGVVAFREQLPQTRAESDALGMSFLAAIAGGMAVLGLSAGVAAFVMNRAARGGSEPEP